MAIERSGWARWVAMVAVSASVTVWWGGVAMAQDGAGTGAGGKPPVVSGDVVTPAGSDGVAPSFEDDVARYREHLVTLANPFFEGRQAGSKGNRLAADYIEFWFKRFKLTPAFASEERAADGTEVETPRSSFREEFPVGQDVVVTGATVGFRPAGDGAAMKLAEHADYEVMGISGSGDAEGGLVFSGYGMERGPGEDFKNWSSFGPDDDLSGKIALVLRYEPSDEEGKSKFVIGAWSDEAALTRKFAALTKRGVKGILIASPPGVKVPAGKALETTAMTAHRLGRPQPVPIAMLTTEKADALVRATDAKGRSLAELKALADTGGGVIPLPKGRAVLAATVERPPRMTANVGGILEGKGALAKEFLVIGAHFDHLGDATLGGSMKNEVGKMHLGADDNGSGTSGLLLLAERMSREYAALPEGASARSVLFLAFSGEEIGLVGSRYFMDTSPTPVSPIYFMLNMDMIGRLREGKFELHGTESAEKMADWLTPITSAWSEQNHQPIKEIKGGEDPTDSASFYAKQIPVLFFFTGYHPEYHTPGDVSRLVNFEGAVRVVDLVERIARTLSTRTEPMVFHNASAEKSKAARAHAAGGGGDQIAQAAPAQGAGQTGSVTGTRVRFGIMPGDYSGAESGVLVGEVFDGTCAKEAGIKIGDRLVKWDGEAIDTVEDWTAMLQKAKVGDVVEVGLVREKQEMTVKVKLKGREEGAR